jgi:mating pheromone-induced death protein 2
MSRPSDPVVGCVDGMEEKEEKIQHEIDSVIHDIHHKPSSDQSSPSSLSPPSLSPPSLSPPSLSPASLSPSRSSVTKDSFERIASRILEWDMSDTNTQHSGIPSHILSSPLSLSASEADFHNVDCLVPQNPSPNEPPLSISTSSHSSTSVRSPSPHLSESVSRPLTAPCLLTPLPSHIASLSLSHSPVSPSSSSSSSSSLFSCSTFLLPSRTEPEAPPSLPRDAVIKKLDSMRKQIAKKKEESERREFKTKVDQSSLSSSLSTSTSSSSSSSSFSTVSLPPRSSLALDRNSSDRFNFFSSL